MLCYTFIALAARASHACTHFPSLTDSRLIIISSLDQFPIERNAHGAEQESGILVGPGAGVESDMATGDHLGRVPRMKHVRSVTVHSRMRA